MKKLPQILPILLGLSVLSAAQTSGVISYPVNGEVIGGLYASQGTASSVTSVIPAFASTTATLSTSSTTIAVANVAGIVKGELVISTNIPAGTKVVSISGLNVVLSAMPSGAGSVVAVIFESVYFNFDGVPGCGPYCYLTISGAGTAAASFYATVYANSAEWPAGLHTISLTVVDSAGNVSTTGNTNVTVYNSSPAGNCSSTLISGSIYCMEAATASTIGPTASLTLNGPFMAGDVVHASVFLLRPASPYTTLNGALTASATSATISTPYTWSEAATTSTTSPVVTFGDANFCNGNVGLGIPGNLRSGQVISGSAFAPGTTIVNCNPTGLNSNQVTVYPNPISNGSSSASIAYAWPTVTAIAAATPTSPATGTGYALGDILTVTQGGASNGQVMVTSVGAGGSVTGVTPMPSDPTKFYTAIGYSIANHLATTGGTGMGAQVDITAIGFIATLNDQGSGPGYEQVCVTGINGLNWTIVRGFNGTQPIAHPYGSFGGIIAAYDPGPYPSLPAYITDSAMNTWTLIQRIQTDFTDNNTVDAGIYYTTFTSGAAALANAALHDTVTFTHPYAQLGQVDLNTVRYRGLGSIGSSNNAEVTNGYAAPGNQIGTPFNNSMTLNRVIPTAAGNTWTVSPGDLCIVTALGSPYMVVNAPAPGFPINPLIYPLGTGTTGMVNVIGTTVTYISGPPFNTSFASNIAGVWVPGSPVVIGGTTVHFATTPVSAGGGTFTTIEIPPQGSQTYFVADGGSPPNPASGWVLREKDPSRMYNIDNIANSTSCNGGALVTNVDGMGTIGVAFHPGNNSTSPNVTVPNVVGLTQAAAAITGAGLVVGTVTMASSGTAAAGSVISESPVAGTLVNPGSAVNLVVSSGLPEQPAAVSVLPNSGTGSSQTFSFVFSDTQNAQNITGMAMLFNTFGSFANACYIIVDRNQGSVSLAYDSALGASSLLIGSSGVLQNSQCAVSASSVTASGLSVAVSVAITFAASFDGAKNIYMFGTDGGIYTTGWVQTGTYTVSGGGAPAATSASPSFGTGSSQLFHFTVSDQGGAGFLTGVSAFISASPNPANSCYVLYDRTANTISLADDIPSHGASAVTPGSTQTVSNSQCTLKGYDSTVVAGATALVMTVDLTFNPNFAGGKNIYLDAIERNVTSGWTTMGTWTVTGDAPSANSVSPTSGTGLSSSFTFNASDSTSASNISSMAMLIASGAPTNTANACYLVYAPGANTISLYNDAGTATSSKLVGSSATLSNSQCAVGYADGYPAGDSVVFNINLVFAAGFNGAKSVYLDAIESASSSGWEMMGTWTVTGDVPTANYVSPASGTGLSSSFTFNVSDSISASNISSMAMLITSGTPTNTANACYLVYTPGAATVSLYNDGGTTTSSKPIGSSATLSNSQCAVGYADAYPSGSSVVFNINLVFAAGFKGAKSVYLDAIEFASNSGWATVGTWTVQ